MELDREQVLASTVFGLLVCAEEVLLELIKLCGDPAHIIELQMVQKEREHWKGVYGIA